MQVLTGCILYVYVFETLVRLYAFSFSIVKFPLEMIDLVIIITSVVIFILVLSDTASQNYKIVVTFARALRYPPFALLQVYQRVLNVTLQQGKCWRDSAPPLTPS